MGIIYFERLKDGSIGRTTPFKSVAQDNDFLNEFTDRQIVYFGGKKYLEGEIKRLPQYLATRKKEMLAKLNSLFAVKSQNTTVMSSLGFEIDANSTANTNVTGLLALMESGEVKSDWFCDVNNEFHEVTLEDVKTMRDEIIRNAKSIYLKKWTIRSAINNATTAEELDKIEITFD